MKSAKNLRRALKGCQPSTLKATLYRYVNLDYLPTLTSAIGGLRADNRYTAKGLAEVYYAASAPDLAMLEATRQHQREFTTPAFPSHAIMPLEVRLNRVLDLTDDSHYSALGTSFMELTGDWRTTQQLGQRVITQELGAIAYDLGFVAIRYPSAYRGNEWNAALFPDLMDDDNQIRLIVPEHVQTTMEFLTTLELVQTDQVTMNLKFGSVAVTLSPVPVPPPDTAPGEAGP
ncbi:RES domain protein (plasmid) [Deinococcus proteolyticus MRP]|uniref:RES domain protein n=1 Tax=Deinococcus proteolyticus (strain ATCC 35074 / DSM 20540 / JCM 6276 / NBRC 101906 / NCIMB 13154 / VKM Ac-1939 / CCM 2703 / MRP) TaxID=693977 RepID=F0RQ84_DEIPM|nr:RES family NAD+ phosphorylase [Deinococcus proteolyticus]ADY27443.1 RES domain protein [Deinococcus proteolyticus MRP]